MALSSILRGTMLAFGLTTAALGMAQPAAAEETVTIALEGTYQPLEPDKSRWHARRLRA